MLNEIKTIISQTEPELYEAIMKKAVEEYDLSIDFVHNTMRFGQVDDFHMFWIKYKKGFLTFKARKIYNKVRKCNTVRFAFNPSNENNILSAIDSIYQSYLEYKESGVLPQPTIKEVAYSRPRSSSAEVTYILSNAQKIVIERLSEPMISYGGIDAEHLEEISEYGKEIVDIFDSILDFFIKKFDRKSRNFAIYRDRIESDKVTLATIGEKYDLSRERIRQITEKLDNSIFFTVRKAERSEFQDIILSLERISEILNDIDYDILNLVEYGFCDISKRKTEAIISALLGNQVLKMIQEHINDRIAHNEELRKLQKEKQKLVEEWGFYESKFCFPSVFDADPSISVESAVGLQVYEVHTKFYEKIKKFDSMIDIIEHPDIVFYSSSDTDHRPNFMLRLPNGKIVLALVLAAINMAYIYNIKRCNMLHNFCKKNGYGYLIIDDRGNSIYDIKNREIDQNVKGALDKVLSEQGAIYWQDIKHIKESHTLSSIDIAAYVLQNKLNFTVTPYYCIKHRSILPNDKENIANE